MLIRSLLPEAQFKKSFRVGAGGLLLPLNGDQIFLQILSTVMFLSSSCIRGKRKPCSFQLIILPMKLDKYDRHELVLREAHYSKDNHSIHSTAALSKQLVADFFSDTPRLKLKFVSDPFSPRTQFYYASLRNSPALALRRDRLFGILSNCSKLSLSEE